MKFINQNDFFLDSYRISASDYFKKKRENPRPIVLDIRPLEESSHSSVEGAYSLPAEMMEERLIQLPPFGTIIIYSDRSDTNIHDCMSLLWENGFTDIFYVNGGYEAIMADLFTVDEEAKQNLESYFTKNSPELRAVRIEVKGQDYFLYPVKDKKEVEECLPISKDNFTIYIYSKSLRLLEGTKIGYKNGTLVLDHPRMHEPRLIGTIKEQVQKILNEHINPMVSSHGGEIKLVDVIDDKVYIEMSGGCQGCGMSTVTLKHGIETAIKDHIPSINQILDTTDHASGENPYYQP